MFAPLRSMLARDISISQQFKEDELFFEKTQPVSLDLLIRWSFIKHFQVEINARRTGKSEPKITGHFD